MSRKHMNGSGHTLEMPTQAHLINPQPKLPLMHIDPAMFERDFTPTGALVLIRILKPKATAGGIQLPDGAETGAPRRAQIVKVGPGMMNYRANDGTRCPMDPELREGRVIYPMFQGQGMPVKIADTQYYVMDASQIIGFSDAPPESLGG